MTAFLTFSGAALAGGGEAPGEHGFVGVKKCKTCHKKEAIGNQYGAWLDSKHAKAFETLAGEQAREWAAEAGVDDPQTTRSASSATSPPTAFRAERLAIELQAGGWRAVRSLPRGGQGLSQEEDHGRPGARHLEGLDLAAEGGALHDLPQRREPRLEARPLHPRGRHEDGLRLRAGEEAIAHPVPEGYDAMAEGEAD